MDEPVREKVKEWLLLAAEDHLSARTLLKNAPTAGISICFHAQQLAEKALKAYLTSHQYKFEKTHDLLRLVKACEEIDDEFGNYRSIADALTGYAVEIRYPDDYRPVLLKEAREAVNNAENILNFVKAKLDPTILI
jgi:HEPN domain-containing protein